ncbi:helix-turn-helix domain-containing protein [Pseudomonas sp.]|uniref:helix-turn-helix domain-containing protein n=1 Tax=Pseudomonas sp. TaxID=306 RepID=UPI003FD8CAE1
MHQPAETGGKSLDEGGGVIAFVCQGCIGHKAVNLGCLGGEPKGEKSLSQAAVAIDVPQSMISRHISQLERECGVKLFNHSCAKTMYRLRKSRYWCSPNSC